MIDPEGTVRLEAPKYPDIESVVGAAGRLEKPLSWREMLEIATEDHVAEIAAKYR